MGRAGEQAQLAGRAACPGRDALTQPQVGSEGQEKDPRLFKQQLLFGTGFGGGLVRQHSRAPGGSVPSEPWLGAGGSSLAEGLYLWL